MSTAGSTSGASGEINDVGSQSIRAIILSLKPGQFWAVLGVIAALLFGSFTLGSFITTLRKDLEINEAKGAVSKVERDSPILRCNGDVRFTPNYRHAAATAGMSGSCQHLIGWCEEPGRQWTTMEFTQDGAKQINAAIQRTAALTRSGRST